MYTPHRYTHHTHSSPSLTHSLTRHLSLLFRYRCQVVGYTRKEEGREGGDEDEMVTVMRMRVVLMVRW